MINSIVCEICVTVTSSTEKGVSKDTLCLMMCAGLDSHWMKTSQKTGQGFSRFTSGQVNEQLFISL